MSILRRSRVSYFASQEGRRKRTVQKWFRSHSNIDRLAFLLVFHQDPVVVVTLACWIILSIGFALKDLLDLVHIGHLALPWVVQNSRLDFRDTVMPLRFNKLRVSIFRCRLLTNEWISRFAVEKCYRRPRMDTKAIVVKLDRRWITEVLALDLEVRWRQSIHNYWSGCCALCVFAQSRCSSERTCSLTVRIKSRGVLEWTAIPQGHS